MKILVWSSSSFEQWYSSYHLMQELLQAMLNSHHEVWLVQKQYIDGNMPKVLEGQRNLHVVNIQQQQTAKGNFILRYMNGFMYYIQSGSMVKKLKREIGFDACFLQSTNNASIPVRILKRLRIPVLFNVQDIFPIDALVIGKLKVSHPAFIITRWLQARAYKNADRVVTISEDLKKTIVAEGRKDVDVIYNWSYQNEGYFIPDEKNHFLQTYGVKREDGFRVVYAGNVGQMMESEIIVQAAMKLRNEPQIKFYIIGEGSGLNKFKTRVQEEKLENILFFPRQPMDYAQDNYCAADLNINPVPKGVIYVCMPSKTATCLLSQKSTVVSMDLDSDMAKRLKTVDGWKVIAPGDAKALADSILSMYYSGQWDHISSNAVSFLKTLGPVENAYQYVRVMEKMAKERARR